MVRYPWKRKPHDREWSRCASKECLNSWQLGRSSGVGGSQGTLVKQVDNVQGWLAAAACSFNELGGLKYRPVSKLIPLMDSRSAGQRACRAGGRVNGWGKEVILRNGGRRLMADG